MENELSLKEITHGIIAYTLNGTKNNQYIEILHFCGYWQEPTEIDFSNLKKELNTDPSFNLVGRIDKDVFLMKSSPEIIKFYTQ